MAKPSPKPRKHRDEPKMRVSMADIARRAGVHQTTVSLALRNSPKLPPETRDKLRNLAREMGYRQDPLVSTLMAQVHAGRRREESPVLACLNPMTAGALRNIPSFAEFTRGFTQRAEELGYQAQEIACGSHPEAVRDLRKHFLDRGIKAAFLPLTNFRLLQEQDFTGIALVTLTGSLQRLPVHAVGPDHFHNARLATRKLWEAGSRRLLLVVPDHFQAPAVHEWFGAMTAEARNFSPDSFSPKLLKIAPSDHATLAQALRQWKIDGALIYPRELHRTLHDAGARVPDDLNYADPALFPGVTDCAGIDPQRHQAGTAAVDVLVAQIHRGEFGLPPAPRVILNEGRWVPGQSCRAD
jgi:LacI family transcriptional regulator